ncbi:hypothetical protein KSF_106380 [Reticulibacter mediterranei]|uniref:Uncharacterized protein n=1 Tax=Reticulibacter mediterranei TaxID=2778369 RepID=A0A8J3J1I4_9CHLR|nr:hypothetical protein [Reticulibacter mediterranei]GHP00591.1 hypothetical protein KSF_106380 [Reticulibacter mediterranei]
MDEDRWERRERLRLALLLSLILLASAGMLFVWMRSLWLLVDVAVWMTVMLVVLVLAEQERWQREQQRRWIWWLSPALSYASACLVVGTDQ